MTIDMAEPTDKTAELALLRLCVFNNLHPFLTKQNIFIALVKESYLFYEFTDGCSLIMLARDSA